MKPTIALTAAAVALVLASGCDHSRAEGMKEGRVTHVVLCWLKEPDNARQRARMVELSRGFSDIPGVVQVKAGTPVTSDRDIVDDSFDVGISLTFANAEDMRAYLTHPRHKEAAKSVLMPLSAKVLVYDIVE